MTTHAQAIADRMGRPVVIARIDGVGEYAGQWAFASRRVRYSASDLYKTRFVNWPRILNEEANPLGGVAAASQVTIAIAEDSRVDDLTSAFRLEAPPLTALTLAATAAATTMRFDSIAGIAASTTVLWIDDEAVLVGTLVSGTTYNVTRGALGTEAQSHAVGADVYAYIPRLFGRRLRLFIGHDLETFSTGDESEVGGGWNIDSVGLTADFNAWTIRARSQLRYLDRLLARTAFVGYVQTVEADNRLILWGAENQIAPHFQDRSFYELDGGEIIRTQFVGQYLGIVDIDLRGVAGTRRDEVLPDTTIEQVLVADPTDGYGSYRYQDPGSETSSRGTGTWSVTAHPVPILLALMTSSADPSDDTPDNYGTDTGNFSALPGGWGLGIPVSRIDVDSFLDVWVRTQNFALEYFVLRRGETGRDVIDRICRICGYDIKTRNGQISCDYARIPTAGDSTVTWDESVIAREDAGAGDTRPMIGPAKLDTDLTAGAVVFKLKTSRGADVDSTFTDADFPAIFGNGRGYYQAEDQRIEIDAEYVRADVEGGEPEVVRQRALQLLFRWRRPLWRIPLATDLSQDGVEPGDLIALTFPQLPDLATGTRGWVAEFCKVLSKEIGIDPDFVGIHWEVVRYDCGRAGRRAPSGSINGTPSAAGGGDYDIVIHANRYTDPDARGGLPTTDAAAFTVGDRVSLATRGGLLVATTPTYQTITAIASNTITVDGNFGGSGSFVDGTVLRYAGRDDQAAQQYDVFVSLADDTNRNVGASSQTPWTWGEP